MASSTSPAITALKYSLLLILSPLAFQCLSFRFDELCSLFFSNQVQTEFFDGQRTCLIAFVTILGIVQSGRYAFSCPGSLARIVMTLFTIGFLSILKNQLDGSSFLPQYSDYNYMRPYIENNFYIITGANSGVGLTLAKSLVKHGGTVVMACRNDSACLRAADEVNSQTSDSLASSNAGALGKAVPMNLDLASFSNIQNFAKEFKSRYPNKHIDGLILNAGFATAPLNSSKHLTAEGLEAGLGSMHFGHYFLTQELLEGIGGQSGTRIAVTASAASQFPMVFGAKFDPSLLLNDGEGDLRGEITKTSSPTMYGRAKLSNVLFTRELYNMYKSNGVTSCSCHIGAVATSIWDIPFLGSASTTQMVQDAVDAWMSVVLRSTDGGAKPILKCLLSDEEGVGMGGYLDGMGVLVDGKRMSAESTDAESTKALWRVSDRIYKGLK